MLIVMCYSIIRQQHHTPMY